MEGLEDSESSLTPSPAVKDEDESAAPASTSATEEPQEDDDSAKENPSRVSQSKEDTLENEKEESEEKRDVIEVTELTKDGTSEEKPKSGDDENETTNSIEGFDPQTCELSEPRRFTPRDLLSLLRNIEKEIVQCEGVVKDENEKRRYVYACGNCK